MRAHRDLTVGSSIPGLAAGEVPGKLRASLQTIVVDIASDVGRYSMEVVPGDSSGEPFERTGQRSGRPYEELLLRLGVALTRPGDHIVDVGAHMGNHAIYWALAGRRVTAFEPNPMTAALLRANVDRNNLSTSITVIEMALGDRSTSGTIRVPDPANLASAVVDAGDGDITIGRLDDISLAEFRLLKIDVEGHEAQVLRGAGQALRSSRPFVFAEALSGHGYTDQLLAGRGYRRLPLNLAWTDTYLYAPTLNHLVRASLTRPVTEIVWGRLRQRLARLRTRLS